MMWLTPMVGAIAAAIALPALIVLYLLKLRRREVEVSSTFLWDAVIRDMRANAPFQKLRKNILLLIQAIALALAALALAQPGFMGERDPAETTIILIDHSASMAAKESESGTRTRLEMAKEEARRIARASTSGGRARAMVIAFAASPAVLVSPTSDDGELIEAINSLEASESGAFATPALQLAEAHALDNPAATRIVVLSDGAFADDAPPIPPKDAELEYFAIGSDSPPNTGIVSLRAERSYDQPEQVTVFAAIDGNAGARETAEIELTIDGEIVGVRSTRLVQDDETGVRSGAVVVRLNRMRGATIKARLLSEDALASDNEAWVALAPAAQAKVLVVSSGNPFMERALQAAAIAPPRVVTPGEYVELARSGLIDADMVILENYSPPADALPDGAYLSFGAPPPIDGVRVGEADAIAEGEVGAFVSWRKDHPVLAYSGLGQIRVAKAYALEADTSRDIIARMTSGAGIVEVEADGRRAICVGFDPLDTNWLFDRGYVLFLATAIDYLAGNEGGSSTAQLRPGETIATDLPRGAREIELIGPGGEAIEATVRDGTLTHGPIRNRGVYTVSWRGGSDRGDAVVGERVERRFASSMLDPRLTALRVFNTIKLEDAAGGLASTTQATTVPRSLRNWLLLGFIAVLMLEWYVYHRRVEL